MYWGLNKEAYLVEGSTGGVIYDFSKNELYHVNKETANFIAAFPVNDNLLSFEEKSFLEELKLANLVTDDPVSQTKIQDLQSRKPIDFIWIEVTTGCNLKCVHCYDEATCNDIQIMEYEDFCHIVDEVQRYGIKKIQIIGGEPLLLKNNLEKYLDYCDGKFEYIEVFTNGTLMTETMIKYFGEKNIRVALSVYSYNSEAHDYVTGSIGSHEKTNKTIGMLNNFSIPYRVKNVLMKNVPLGEKNTELYTLSQERDVVRLTGRANINLLNKELIMKKLITEEAFSTSIRKPVVVRNLSGHNCFSRRLYFSVDSTVYPCVMERRINHGNLKKHSLSVILNEKILNLNKDQIDECCNCEYRYSCHDCRPDSFGKGLRSKPWYCTYDPQTGKWADKDKFADALLQKGANCD